MQPEIKVSPERKLIGIKIITSLSNNKTFDLWKGFMPRRKEITNNLSKELLSLQIYKPTYFSNFDIKEEFEKWALVEVTDFNSVPDKMETLILPEGEYAVFNYKGLDTNTQIFQYIFGTWLPKSIYQLDNRPHFEILGEKYKHNDPNSEEEIWVPIRSNKKNNL